MEQMCITNIVDTKIFNKTLILPANEVKGNIKSIKKDYGIFFTPEWVVDFMVKMINDQIKNKRDALILEPACGIAQFLTGIKRNNPLFFKRSKKFGVEINEEFIGHMMSKKISAENINIICSDYLLWQPRLLFFDLIIGNPPYGIPSLSEHYTIRVDDKTKQKYKSLFITWHGKYNVYGAFIEKSIRLLKENGQLIFIVPATFILLDEFKKLREFLSRNGETNLIYMGPDVFKPEADVASVILNFIKSRKVDHRFVLSCYHKGQIKTVVKKDRWKGEIITFITLFSKKIENSCSYKLGDVYDIRISPRTPEIKHNPEILKTESIISNDYLPILNGRNLNCNKILYEPKTGYWIRKNKITNLRKFFTMPRIVVGLGFRGKGKVAAAYDERCYPWMGDVYHLLKKSSLISHDYDLTDQEVVEYLNSEIIENYVKSVFKEITYHLSITQLKMLPLPTKGEWKRLKEEYVGQKLAS
jgi:adenine-specific DNA-methyltransferase